MRLPIILFEKVFGSGSIGLLTGFGIVYILTIVAPTDNKKTAKTLVIIYLVLLAIGSVALFINGAIREDILWVIMLTIGILLAWRSIRHDTEKESEKYEQIVQKNIKSIFISTLLFTILSIALFLFI